MPVKCNACPNTRNFVIEGREIRIVDTNETDDFIQYFVETSAICISCKSTDVELSNLHPDLVAFAAELGLTDRVG